MTNASKLYQFINCKILRNHRIVKEDIWVRDGKIVNPERIFYDEKISADVKIDCKGLLLAPGFIELQINGGYGYDFSFIENTEAGIELVSKKLLEHGVIAYCPTVGVLMGQPFLVHMWRVLLSIKKRKVPILPTAFWIIKMAYLNWKGCMELKKRNVIVSLGHSTADLLEGEEALEAGASLITHLFNAMLPFHHRDPGLVGLLASDKITQEKKIFFGIIPDGIHTHPAALRIAYRVHPDGLIMVTDAISAAGLNEGQHKIGQLDIEIRDNKAFIAGTNTLCGSIATMSECVRNFMKATGCSPEYALESASLHPAQALGIEDQKGTLNFGADADFIMLDETFEIVSTWISGQLVYNRTTDL
ncbi:hypothetical protein GWI33_002077 [Rhynchophorus ferrugineus]|uniref:N-acetylglucosamine-6-phosphate deacetylase n=1 Tax=Rhynchophorus ferrugineus TaxID=354439 RepID=A0A834ML64_RHYFE|nr:hypothetical protein GWI33_002077 [Rhynchophorus ferrugineus]